MKGLAIAEDFFLNWGLLFLEAEYPALTQRLAAGRFGGSDVLGADDELSRDHNWGPQFTLFLSEEDFSSVGEELSERMNAAAPDQWNGYWVDGAGDKNVLVRSVPRWIQQVVGFAELPQADADWGLIVKDRAVGGFIEARESSLYFLKHGALWLDNNDDFRAWRLTLARYPENVWYGRLAEETFRLWQYGEYNFVQRIAVRGDPLAIAMSLGKFTEGVMRLMLLLDGDFTPYWKWLAYEFRKLDTARQYAPLLESLLASSNVHEQAKLVQQICWAVHQHLIALGLIDGHKTDEYDESRLYLFEDHHAFTAKAAWMPTIK